MVEIESDSVDNSVSVTRQKIIFVGDPMQLPPVGDNVSNGTKNMINLAKKYKLDVNIVSF